MARISRPDLASSLAFAGALLVAAALFWLFHGRGYDDPYITYRYAANIARGYGFVYNQGERVLSTTTPLYTLILATLRLAGLDLPLVSNAISCLSLAAGGWALWELGRVWRTRRTGAAAFFLLPTFPLLVTTLGAETTFGITLILLGFLAYACGRYIAAAVLLAIATLTRADGVLVAAVLGIDFLLWKRRPIPWRAVIIYSALVVPWFAFAWLYFGAPFPVTLFVKQQQAHMANSQTFLEGFFPTVRSYLGHPLYGLHFALAATGLCYALFRHRRALLLPAWSVLYFAAYAMLGVSRYHWYYAPLAAGFVTLVAFGVAALSRILERFGGRSLARAGAALLVLLLLVPQMGSLQALRTTNDNRLLIYRTAGEWLRTNTPPEASVGALEVGIIGYYADRRMIDFAGLIQPETALRFTPTTTYEDAALWAVSHFRPDYLVLQDSLFPRLEADPTVVAGCRRLQTFRDTVYQYRLVAYKCAS